MERSRADAESQLGVEIFGNLQSPAAWLPEPFQDFLGERRTVIGREVRLLADEGEVALEALASKRLAARTPRSDAPATTIRFIDTMLELSGRPSLASFSALDADDVSRAAPGGIFDLCSQFFAGVVVQDNDKSLVIDGEDGRRSVFTLPMTSARV